MKIELVDLRYQYPEGKKEVFQGFNLEVPQRKVTCLLGPSGAGKSTLLKLVAGLLPGYQGQIWVNRELLATKTKDYYQSVGVLLENPGFFDRLSLRENLTYFAGLYHRHRPLEPLLDQLGLTRAADTLGAQLSQGMVQRLGLARALLHEPDLLILDEPTAGLDPELSRQVLELLKAERNRGVTLLISSQQMDFAESLSDQLVLIKAGKRIAHGSLSDLLRVIAPGSVEVTYHDSQGTHKTRFDLGQLSQNQPFLTLLDHPGLVSVQSPHNGLAQLFHLPPNGED